MPPSRARLALLGSALLFSTGGAAIKATALSSLQVACFRSAVAALAIYAFMPRARRGWTRRTLAVALAYATTMILFVSANKLTTAANTIFLQSTAPLYVLALSPWLLGESASRRDISYMLVLAAGLSLFFVGVREPDRLAPNPLLGNTLAVLAGVSWGLTVLGLRWLARPDASGALTDNLTGVLAGNVLAAAVCAPWALPSVHFQMLDLAVISFLGLFQIAGAYLLLTRGVARVPAFEASLLLLIEPVLNPIWAWLLHGESPGTWAVLGGGLILGATAARTWRQRERGLPHPPSAARP